MASRLEKRGVELIAPNDPTHKKLQTSTSSGDLSGGGTSSDGSRGYCACGAFTHATK